MREPPKFRFTIRDLLLLTTVVAVVFAGVANLRQVDLVLKRVSTSIWNRVSKTEPPLMGRDSVEPEW